MLVTFGSGQVESGALATWLRTELLSEGGTQLLLDQTSTQSTCFNILTILSDVKISCDSMLLFCLFQHNGQLQVIQHVYQHLI